VSINISNNTTEWDIGVYHPSSQIAGHLRHKSFHAINLRYIQTHNWHPHSTGFPLSFDIGSQGPFKDFHGSSNFIFKDQFSMKVYSMILLSKCWLRQHTWQTMLFIWWSQCLTSWWIQRLSRTCVMKFNDFQAPVLFSSTFKALNLGEQNSSTFKYFQGCVEALTQTNQQLP